MPVLNTVFASLIVRKGKQKFDKFWRLHCFYPFLLCFCVFFAVVLQCFPAHFFIFRCARPGGGGVGAWRQASTSAPGQRTALEFTYIDTPPHWHALLPTAYCNEELGQSAFMLIVIDALESGSGVPGGGKGGGRKVVCPIDEVSQQRRGSASSLLPILPKSSSL